MIRKAKTVMFLNDGKKLKIELSVYDVEQRIFTVANDKKKHANFVPLPVQTFFGFRMKVAMVNLKRILYFYDI